MPREREECPLEWNMPQCGFHSSIHFSPQLKPHGRDTSERPIAHDAGDGGDEGAPRHRRVDAEAIEQLRDIATDRGTSKNTIRTHVRGVLEKTGCNRQADIVALKLLSG